MKIVNIKEIDFAETENGLIFLKEGHIGCVSCIFYPFKEDHCIYDDNGQSPCFKDSRIWKNLKGFILLKEEAKI